ncbi:uncharacterized protein [Bactrocera oleae]|uniref:uncharacterized protein isoform X2 n=1 Tax=Bactrocera oleae TaxID=104688 RepID=UPI00387EC3B2
MFHFLHGNCDIGEYCGNPKVSAPGLSNEVVIEMVWSKSFAITNRTYIFLITYAAVSALWIVTSLLVLASICGRVTNLVAAISFWPWFLIVIGGSILDGVATGYYICDVINTTTVSDAFTYIGANTTNGDLMNFLESYDAYFITPALVMTCLSSRVVLIWLLNIFGTGFCLSLSHVLAKNSSSLITNESSINTSGDHSSSIANIEKNMINTNPRRSEVKPIQFGVNTPEIVTEQASIQNEISFNDHPTPNTSTTIRQVSSVSTQNDSAQLNTVENNTSYRHADSHPDRLDYPATNSRPISPISPILPLEQVQHLSTETPLNSRYSSVEQSNSRLNAELRSQLPWSYTNMLGKPQVPLKPQKQIYPEIPKPDYTT